MSDIAIHVSGLGKRYRIGANQQAYRTLREKLNEAALAPFRAAKSILTRNGNGQGGRQSSVFGQSHETFWALKDVSFEVKRGEVVGIIGRNGAGKSTLLKILSRITEPTEGYADINGRIASLLEVGTGFHPELTGRENIFLNGSILGMKRVEILKKFDEMVAFAEIEKFIDTPVKHYSSGMYVRLAFAVAAHLDPEIMLVDEVLAVGDAAFQKKCVGKMSDVAKEGRTVLFVSHNMQVISKLCQECLLLSNGAMKIKGPTHQVVREYLVESNTQSSAVIDLTNENIKRSGTGSSRFIEAQLMDSNGRITPTFQVGESFVLRFKCEVRELLTSQFYQIRLRSVTGIPIYHWVDFDDGLPTVQAPGTDEVRVSLDNIQLYPGSYLISLMVSDRYGTEYDYIEDAIAFDVTSGSIVPLTRPYFSHLGIMHEVPKWSR